MCAKQVGGGQNGHVRGYFNNPDDTCQRLEVREGERPSVCVLKVELNEMWNLRETGESRMVPILGKRNSKGEERSRLEAYQQVGPECVKFRMIQGHLGGSWRSEGGVRDKDGAGPLIVTCPLYRLSSLTNPFWDFRKSLLKQSLLCHTQGTNIISFCLAHQSRKTRTRSLCVVIPSHTRDRHFLQASATALAPCKSTALLFASIALFGGSPLLPGVASSSVHPLNEAPSNQASPHWVQGELQSRFNNPASGHMDWFYFLLDFLLHSGVVRTTGPGWLKAF